MDAGRIELRETALTYVATCFVFDLAATIPWDSLTHGDSTKPNLMNMFRFLCLFRLFKLVRLKRIIRTRESTTLFEVNRGVKYGYLRLATLFIIVALILHWFA